MISDLSPTWELSMLRKVKGQMCFLEVKYAKIPNFPDAPYTVQNFWKIWAILILKAHFSNFILCSFQGISIAYCREIIFWRKSFKKLKFSQGLIFSAMAVGTSWPLTLPVLKATVLHSFYTVILVYWQFSFQYAIYFWEPFNLT